jgi:hypothetical protein
LIEVATLRQANDGQRSKTELMYHYLTGPRFRVRIEAIVDKFTEMQTDLDRERKVITRLWAKREQHHRRHRLQRRPLRRSPRYRR